MVREEKGQTFLHQQPIEWSHYLLKADIGKRCMQYAVKFKGLSRSRPSSIYVCLLQNFYAAHKRMWYIISAAEEDGRKQEESLLPYIYYQERIPYTWMWLHFRRIHFFGLFFLLLQLLIIISGNKQFLRKFAATAKSTYDTTRNFFVCCFEFLYDAKRACRTK